MSHESNILSVLGLLGGTPLSLTPPGGFRPGGVGSGYKTATAGDKVMLDAGIALKARGPSSHNLAINTPFWLGFSFASPFAISLRIAYRDNFTTSSL